MGILGPHFALLITPCNMPPGGDPLQYTGGAPELFRAAANNVTPNQHHANSMTRFFRSA